MSRRPAGKLQHASPPPPPSDGTAVRARRPDAGIARGPGLAVAGVVAAIVFVIGQQLFPIKPRQPPAPPAAPPVAPVTPPPVAPPAVDAGGSTAAAGAEAGTVATTAGDAGKKVEAPDETAAPEKTGAEEATEGAAPARKPIDKQRQADRELAREAWRRNRPDISVLGTKTSILVPIRGSIKGADFKILRKTRTVVVTLPRAVSMVTLPVYNLKHPSFKKLWIDQDEANAQPKDGSKLRLILSQTLDPQVEITEDFVRITIRRPASAASDEAPAEKHRGSRSEKNARPEKNDEPADEAPAPEKPAEKAPEKGAD